jgi:hypothetical protein
MARRIRVVAALATALTCGVLALACQNGAATATDEAGKPVPKLVCKVNNQCWICPDEGAMKKCIINPLTSGCKQATGGECP